MSPGSRQLSHLAVLASLELWRFVLQTCAPEGPARKEPHV